MESQTTEQTESNPMIRRAYDVVRCIAEMRHGMTINCIADALGCSRRVANRYVNAARDAGLIHAAEIVPSNGGRPNEVFKLNDVVSESMERSGSACGLPSRSYEAMERLQQEAVDQLLEMERKRIRGKLNLRPDEVIMNAATKVSCIDPKKLMGG